VKKTLVVLVGLFIYLNIGYFFTQEVNRAQFLYTTRGINTWINPLDVKTLDAGESERFQETFEEYLDHCEYLDEYPSPGGWIEFINHNKNSYRPVWARIVMYIAWPLTWLMYVSWQWIAVAFNFVFFGGLIELATKGIVTSIIMIIVVIVSIGFSIIYLIQNPFRKRKKKKDKD
jgi:uncharacterized protein YxeA